MTEPDVALTDFGLALLCSWFAWRRQGLWRAFFASLALASVTGGTVHGFFLDETTLGYRILWPATLIAIGLTAAVTWTLAGLSLTGPRRLKAWIVFAAAVFGAYTAVVVFYSQAFAVAVFNYLPAMIALLAASVWDYARTRRRGALWIASGIAVGFLAAFLQRAGIAIDPTRFNHNATYHVVQAVGLALMFRGSERSQGSDPVNPPDPPIAPHSFSGMAPSIAPGRT